jgi:uncharacterized protein (TIGR03083 family)
MSDMELVDHMEQVWRSIAALCSAFTEDQWKTATDCPGWSVQDQISHLVGAEAGILGQPSPDHAPAETSHVKNEVGQRNEVVVDWRRSSSGAKVLEEFRQATEERLGLLRAMKEADFQAETQTPIGPGTVADFLSIRIFDAWIHEQDIRRAVGIAGHLEGPVAAHSVGRVARAMPFVVGKKAAAPDGTTVVFHITGDAGRVLPVAVEGNRARVLDEEPADPTVRLTMDAETFACLGCGRWSPGESLVSGKVALQGSKELGETIVNQMNIMI